MPLEFRCPHCGIQTNVDDRYSGQSGPCSGCGKTVSIPTIGRAVGTVSAGATGGGAIIAVSLIAVLVIGMLFCGGAGLFMTRMTPMPVPGPTAIATVGPLCTNNLKALGLAMHNYHDVYKTFPPAYVAADDGTPMHSWRVLLLPYLGRQDLYNQYDFDEPWDGPNNSQLISMVPAVFRCPDDVMGGPYETSYAMIVGPGFLGNSDAASRISNITDGTSNTIMFVESHGSGIVWTEPRDLDGTTISFLINTRQVGELQGHREYMGTVFCDASVHELPDTTPPEEIRAMATIAGGEVVAVP